MSLPDQPDEVWPTARYFAGQGGSKLAYRQFGDLKHPAVILIHCIGLDGRMWSQVLPALSSRFRVIVPDLRGHGASNSRDGECEIEDMAADILALCDHLKIERAGLIGCSIGANISMWLGANHADKFDRIVLANGPAHLKLPKEIADSVSAVALAGEMPALARDMVARWVTEEYRGREDGVPFERLVSQMADCPGNAFVAAFQALLRSDRTADLPRISVPALVVAGRMDFGFDAVAGGLMADAIPAGHLAIIDGAAHLPAVERPDAFSASVLEFL